MKQDLKKYFPAIWRRKWYILAGLTIWFLSAGYMAAKGAIGFFADEISHEAIVWGVMGFLQVVILPPIFLMVVLDAIREEKTPKRA